MSKYIERCKYKEYNRFTATSLAALVKIMHPDLAVWVTDDNTVQCGYSIDAPLATLQVNESGEPKVVIPEIDLVNATHRKLWETVKSLNICRYSRHPEEFCQGLIRHACMAFGFEWPSTRNAWGISVV